MRFWAFIFLFVSGAAALGNPSEVAGFDLQGRRASHWAWQPVRPQAPPAVKNLEWSNEPIDRFILAKLEEAGLAPAGQAGRRTLIRRASFDLIGLPPTPPEVEAFVNDSSPDAFAKVVDRLLASPHFGETWARHWMDLVRYSETYGHEFDYPIANAWRYRDYLIRAFNADVPYDQFVREHIAGDLLPSPRRNPADGFNESVLATAFWIFGEQLHAPVDVRQHQMDYVDNQIDVFGKTFLGMTVACARCHDHKFDAIRQSDYYALAGYIESARRQDVEMDPGGKVQAAAAQLDRIQSRASKLMRESLPPSAELHAQVAATFAAEKPLLSAASVNDPADPLFAWSRLSAADSSEDFASRRRAAIGQIESAQTRADETAAQSKVFKDFHDGSFAGWFTSGFAFGTRPTRSGDCEFSASGWRPVLPGLAGSAAASPAERGVLRSPTFVLTHPQILYHLAGSHAKVRLIIDGYMMDQFSALLFAGAAFNVDTRDQFVWHRQAQDIGRYIGHRAYIEITDDGGGWVDIDQIRFADNEAPTPAPVPSEISRTILSDPAVTSLESLGAAYGAIAERAVDHFKSSAASADECRLVRWLLDHRAIQLDAHAASKLAAMHEHSAQISSQMPAPQYAQAVTDGDGFDENLLIRGNPRTPGAVTPRHFLEALGASDQPAVRAGTSGRLELAGELTDPANPLVSRVMVNRIWHHLMGRGIVASVDNFGLLGERPSHPELLDYLADRFLSDGWSIKKTIRTIMLSRTYQMSSAATDPAAEQRDPANTFLHRASIRRLPAEAIRDEILAVSGRLDEQMFGPPVDVYLTPFMEGRGRPAASGPLDGAGRRSIYLAVRRNFLTPMLLVFDMPVPFSTMGRRTVSNVPAQALALMNDPFAAQQAALWATNVLKIPDLSVNQRLDLMFREAFARPLSDQQRSRILDFLDRQAQARKIAPAERATSLVLWSDLADALFNAKEFVFLN